MKDGLVDRAGVLRIIQEARESGETDLRQIRALVEYLPAATPPTTPSDAAMRAAEEIVRLIQDEYEHGAASVEPEIAAIITRNLAASASPTPANNHEAVVRQVVEGCSNWHDIQHKIVPRIIALLNTSEAVELQIARRFLVKHGYERCASAACGCNSWHERRP